MHVDKSKVGYSKKYAEAKYWNIKAEQDKKVENGNNTRNSK